MCLKLKVTRRQGQHRTDKISDETTSSWGSRGVSRRYQMPFDDTSPSSCLQSLLFTNPDYLLLKSSRSTTAGHAMLKTLESNLLPASAVAMQRSTSHATNRRTTFISNCQCAERQQLEQLLRCRSLQSNEQHVQRHNAAKDRRWGQPCHMHAICMVDRNGNSHCVPCMVAPLTSL